MLILAQEVRQAHTEATAGNTGVRSELRGLQGSEEGPYSKKAIHRMRF